MIIVEDYWRGPLKHESVENALMSHFENDTSECNGEIERMRAEIATLKKVVASLAECLLGERRDNRTIDEHIKVLLGHGFEVKQGHGLRRFL